MERQYIDFEENGKAHVLYEENNMPVTVAFNSKDEIERFSVENPDFPSDIKQDLLDRQAVIEAERSLKISKEASSANIGIEVGLGIEGKYAIFARHGELENKLSAGKKPTEAEYEQVAKQDASDFAKLSENDRKAVMPDLLAAAKVSPAYSKIITPKLELDALSPKVLSGETLDEEREFLARNSASPLNSKNTIEVERSGSELGRGAFVLPASIVKNYEQVGLEFRAKPKGDLAFRENPTGNSFHTETTNKDVIHDMVALAKAKQWTTLSLEGSKDFRREAWLQAESQGMRTSGYTATKDDIEQLKAMKAHYQNNSITNTDAKELQAPRTKQQSSESVLQNSAMLNLTKHMEILSENPAFKDRSEKDLITLSVARSTYMEAEKEKGVDGVKLSESMAKFDAHFENPVHLANVEKETKTLQEVSLPTRKTQEQELTH